MGPQAPVRQWDNVDDGKYFGRDDRDG